MRFILVLLVFFGLAAPTHAQGVWSRSDSRLTLDQAKISFPLRADRLALTESKEFSRQGESLDAVAQYESADRKVFATVYVYYPGMAHSGMAAVATDVAIRLRSRDHPVVTSGSQVVAAGGTPGVAVRTDYDGFLGDLASSAAFIKAGRWMVKLRASGPRDRQDEIKGAMSALLDNVRFEGKARPRPTAVIDTPACPAADRTDARLLPDDEATITFHAIVLASVDPAGESRREKVRGRKAQSVPARIGTRWCRGYVDVQGTRIQLLRATDPETSQNASEGKSVLLALYSDAGGALEVVREREFGTKYVLLRHEIGSTSLLGTFDALPSDRQMAEFLAGRGEAVRPRAEVGLKANGDSELVLRLPPPAPAPPTT